MPSKSRPRFAGGERAGEQHGQERPDADRRGDAEALEEVEDEVHVVALAFGARRMTIDETPRGRAGGARPARHETSSATAGLFAQRTQGMKSSAMRDLMAVTARPEVISLAGGLPDTTHVPGRGLRAR